ncbi:hypothetical protein [Streptomyces sp. DSM 118148]|uniref:hypothetical protein n=1 Tax=Streptomyces sp. DSM 118148 TaxID=3448667 RepID=UPI00403FEC0A
MWNKRALIAATVMITTTGMLAACGASGSGHDAAPAAAGKPLVDKANWPKATPQRGLAKGLSLPLEAYMQTYADTVTLDTATRHLQEKCMAGYGFDVKLTVAGATPPPNDNDANMERRYGLTDRATAAEYGYGLPEALTDQPRQKVPDLSEAQVEVLTGHGKPTKAGANGSFVAKAAPKTYNGKKIHAKGCAGYAAEKIAEPAADLQLVSELNGRSFVQSMDVPAVKKAMGAWSQCMKGKGYEAATPTESAELVPHTDPASQKEIDVALAEIDCKRQTGLVKVWFKAETKIQKQQIADHRGRLTAAKAENTKALTAAGAALKD